jgi:hypothetical protein
LNGKVAAPGLAKPTLTAMEIHCADHVTPSFLKSCQFNEMEVFIKVSEVEVVTRFEALCHGGTEGNHGV